MSAAREIRPAVLERQIAAADPERSVFVSANAGSGKTHVLAQRVINLLLRGTPPERILCITFTKAAAANMATRVFDTLAAWTALDDAALDAKIKASTGKPSDAHQRAAARRLFATALETPGGLKVQTIHAFCTRLLHQFPFEADVAASFEVLDDAATSQLLNELTLEVTMQAAAEPESALGKALAIAIISAADITFKEVIAEAIGMRDVISRWVDRAGNVAAAIDELTRMFGLASADTLEAVENEYFSASLIPESERAALIDALSTGSKTDKDRAAALANAQRANGRERVDFYIDVFCTGTRKRRENIVTKPFVRDNPRWAERLLAEQDRVCKLVAREFAVRARDRSAALLTIADAVIERYRAAKDRRGLLDYEDLIDKTLALFGNTTAAWVLYKLDLGIDHVLVDEAQDTSPKQWEIVRTLVAEFVGGGARENVKRTVFAVGDEKQSIFSFQGAAPLAFAENRRHFAALFQEAFVQERLEYSFRSGPVVLNAVDTVFSREEAYSGLSHDQVKTVHQAVYEDAPGEVEIWGLIAPDEKNADKEGWDAPFDITSETSPAIKLAGKIARTVKQWCARGTRPRDVLILVRQRGPVFEAAIRALKREAIPVAGADRLVLTEHIAVMDLLALGDALLLPDDDLALATVLKSPLFGLNDEELYTLAYDRRKPLRSVLRERSGNDLAFAAASDLLDEFSANARTHAPFAFYAHVLGAKGGRKNFLARLGIEASDPLDEFLNLALDYQRRETASLQGFLDWLRAAQSEVKRDMEMERDEVRVMTVHGAKGLEAKNVILIDATTTRPEGAHPPRLLTTPITSARADAEAVIWAVAKDKDAGPMSAARATALNTVRDEYRRLLYVGMTRAAERLIVCGTKGVNKISESCWHQLVLDALKPESVESADDDVGTVWRFSKNSGSFIGGTTEAERPPVVLPDWLHKPATPDPAPPRVITPSDLGDDEPRRSAGHGYRDKALRRGTLTHRLLQSLPDIPRDRRQPAMQCYLDRSAKDLSAEDRVQIAEHVMRILDDSRFAELFASGSRAEVPIVGKLHLGSETVLVSGQVDRLSVTPGAVLIGDFKTNRPPPHRIEEVPQPYVRQLALYRAVLMKLYPDRPVRAALIWTEVPDLMELSAGVMDAAMAPVTST
jgi:ATP-dependent helicase/nuclease subunit A